MSAQSLLHSVFSCSSPAPGSTGPGFSKRKLRQTRSLDPALIGGCGGDGGAEGGSGAPGSRLCSPLPLAEGLGGRLASSPRGPHSRANRLSSPRPLCASFSTPSTPLEKSPSGSFHFDYEVPAGRSLKKSTAWDLPSVLAGQGSRSTVLCSSGGGSSSIFASPRRWLQQRKLQSPPSSHGHPYVVWKCEYFFAFPSTRCAGVILYFSSSSTLISFYSDRELITVEYLDLVGVEIPGNVSIYMQDGAKRGLQLSPGYLAMALFNKANCRAATLALNMLGWIFTMVSMGLPNWRTWYIENSPAPPWGLACVGMWKVCTYHPNGLQSRPIACHRYTYSDTYLPLDILLAQHLLLVASLLGLLGKGFMVMGLRRVYTGQLQKDTISNLFFTSKILSIIASAFIFIAVLCNYHAVLNEEGIDFPPSFHIPYRPDRQEIGSTMYLAILAAFLMLLSGLFTISFQLPPKAKYTPKSQKCEVPSCEGLQIHDEQFMRVK